MLYINILCITVIVVMLMLKGKSIFSLAEWILEKRFMKSAITGVSNAIGKIHVVSEKRRNEMARAYMIKLLTGFIFMFLVINIVSVAVLLLAGDEKTENALTREGYGGDEISYEILIKKGEDSEVYSYDVKPREYTYEDFLVEAENTFDYLEEVVLADNSDMDNIESNMYFPEKNEAGTLNVIWSTDNSDVINNRGVVSCCDEDYIVNISATVFSDEYVSNKTWKVRVLKTDNKSNDFETAKKELESIEIRERTNEVFEIPERINDMEIEIKKVSVKDKICKAFIFFVVIIAALPFVKVEKLISEGKKRDEILELQYFEFINRLVLLLGAGETVRGALRKITEEACQEGGAEKRMILNAEIRTLINEIDSGVPEDKAFSECGRRLGIPAYMKLMNLIGQNVTRGNSNLLELLEQEELDAATRRKDVARKKGEEASGKLLMPMIILLVVVMAMIMFPAVSQFVEKI